MPRIIEGTSMNITGEKIKYYRKMQKTEPATIIR